MGFEIEYTCEECCATFDGYYDGEPEEITCEYCGERFCRKCSSTSECSKCNIGVCDRCVTDDMCEDCYDESIEETEEVIKEQEKV